MYHLSDKELDRLSKEAADQFDVEQSTSGWEALEKKLDKDLPVAEKKRRRRFLFVLLFTAIVSGGGLIYLLIPFPVKVGDSEVKHNKIKALPESSIDKQEDAPLKIETEHLVPDENEHESKAIVVETAKERKTLPTNGDKETNVSTNKNDPANKNFKASRNGKPGSGIEKQNIRLEDNDQKTVINKKPGTRDQHRSEGIPPVLSTKATSGNVDDEPPGKTKTAWPTGVALRQKAAIDLATNSASIDPSTFNRPTEPGKEVTGIKKPQLANRFTKGFEVGIIGSPDMSSVNFSHKDKTGYNAGATFSYRLSNRVSIQSGLIYTKKIYTADGSDYHPPKGYWTYNTELHTVNGECTMFDIPINIRYDLSAHPKNRFFVSGGVSSYLMKEETYNYHFTYNGVYGSRNTTYGSDENHFLSILNFSVGFDSKISKRFSLQVEPYFKIPVQGLGFGSIKLNSYGAYLGFRYKPFDK